MGETMPMPMPCGIFPHAYTKVCWGCRRVDCHGCRRKQVHRSFSQSSIQFPNSEGAVTLLDREIRVQCHLRIETLSLPPRRKNAHENSVIPGVKMYLNLQMVCILAS